MGSPFAPLPFPSPRGESVGGGSGLRYDGKAVVPGAQTERRGDAGPVRLLLGGETHRPLDCNSRGS
jgi:hypothetical protein